MSGNVKGRGWRREDGGKGAGMVGCFFSLILTLLLTGCSARNERVVVIYTSQDQEYAEVILRDFTKETGIEVRAVYDNEAVKTIGLVNRLLAEKEHPQCDVFWNNEELRTRQLAGRNIFREADGWTTMGYRARQLVFNTGKITSAKAETLRFAALTNAEWRGKVAMAYPLFGTTATHFLFLRQAWGEEKWLQWCRAFQNNRPLLVDGNSVVVRMVGKGEASVGVTDSDDIATGRREGLPVAGVPLPEDGLLISNSLGVIRGSPHPLEAQRLYEYLQSPAVLEKLVTASALISRENPPEQLSAGGWRRLMGDLDSASTALKQCFLR